MIGLDERSIGSASEQGSAGNPSPPLTNPDENLIERYSRMLCKGLSSDRRLEIISAYLGTLDRVGSAVALESDLPYEKDLIGLAILEELLESPDSELRSHLEIAYIQLESFIPYDDFKVLDDFKNASLVARQMADTGDPASIISSVQMMRRVQGDLAVSIQEQISRKMKKRQAQLKTLYGGTCTESIPDCWWGLCC